MKTLRSQYLTRSKRVVVKVGSKLLVDMSTGGLNVKYIRKLVQSILQIRETGREVVLVSSGAVGAGMAILGYDERPTEIGTIQACAALGQVKLNQVYENVFRKFDVHFAQILISADDFRDRKRYKNISNTIESILDLGIVPIINENDSITVDEIKVGDNDKLSADVTQFLDADILMIFTDENGLYNANPKENPDAKLLPIVPKINNKILSLASGKGSAISTGGMKTKLKAIKQAVEANCAAVLANGNQATPYEILQGEEKGTFFLPARDKTSHRKRWIGLVSHTRGSVVIDVGAMRALQTETSSLLLVGVIRTEGEFSDGDIIQIVSNRGKEIGRGVAKFKKEEVDQLLGMNSREVKNWLKQQYPDIKPHKHPDVCIHRNDMYLF